MNKKTCEIAKQNVLHFKCKKIISGGEKSTAPSPAYVKKPGMVDNKDLEFKIACQTPEKTNEPSQTKVPVPVGQVKLPKKWVPLCLIIPLPKHHWLNLIFGFFVCFQIHDLSGVL